MAIGYLANDLARSVSLSPVFYELNRFQIPVIKWLGRQQELEASWQDLVTAIDGRVSADYLEAQLRGPRLWGLADYDPSHRGWLLPSSREKPRLQKGRRYIRLSEPGSATVSGL